MISYLLDTNVISELRRPKPHGAVVAWLKSLSADQIFLSAVTLGELQTGIERVRKRDATKADEIEAWVNQLEESASVLAMDSRCFREWARLMEGSPEELLEDGMIAATARVHSLTVATRNERDFARFGIPVVNPFKMTA